MTVAQHPAVGSWYLNQSGKLMKVKLLVYRADAVSRVLLEYLDGTRQCVNIDAWNFLDLNRQPLSGFAHTEAGDG